MRRTPALIVGGGPAGAATAITLAGAGHAVRLIERRPVPSGIVCGGFVAWDALAALTTLGIDVAALAGRPIVRLRLVAGRRAIEADLPHAAVGLSRPVLDAALLARAADRGVAIERGRVVRTMTAGGVLLDDGATIAADTIVVATGKHGLRGLPRRGKAGVAGTGAVGFRATIAAPPDLAGTIELHLLRGGYAGLLVQEDGRANVCLSVAAGRLREAGGTAEALLDALAGEAPRLIERIGTMPEKWDAIAGVPYGWRARTGDGGHYRVGDQAAVIGSLAGDGIAVALASGIAAARAIARGEDAARYQPRFARRARRPLAAAELLRAAAERPSWQPLLLGAATIPGLAGLAARLTRIGT